MNSTPGVDICHNSLMILLFIQYLIGFSLTVTALVYDCGWRVYKTRGFEASFLQSHRAQSAHCR
jgi:hypothetical protein